MLRAGVLVSGGGTNLQAILDAIDNGVLTNTQIAVVISNNPGAYALERAKNHGIEAVCISPKEFSDRADFEKALLEKIDQCQLDLIVLAGFLVKIPEDHDRPVCWTHYQYSPIPDPVLLRRGILWAEGS